MHHALWFWNHVYDFRKKKYTPLTSITIKKTTPRGKQCLSLIISVPNLSSLFFDLQELIESSDPTEEAEGNGLWRNTKDGNYTFSKIFCIAMKITHASVCLNYRKSSWLLCFKLTCNWATSKWVVSKELFFNINH